MTVIVRAWLSFAAIGAGIIHLALVISSPLAIGIPLALFGIAELTWGVLILVKDRLVSPRLAHAGAVTPLLLWSLLTVTVTLLAAPQVASSLRFVPMGIAAIFELFIAGVLSVILRRQTETETEPSTPAAKPATAVKYLSAVIVAGVLVGALTTPALAATQAGAVAIEHGGTMGGMMTMNLPGMGH
ncbi:hypothetical protein [Glaciihabitans sp. GrIS 2.15]|uniref:hypothetical protein n=1 Tax=Glaciihabitans sp. GrIS 2.15 TaxID=3071710 RepID=UPI002E0BAAC6|nr:hypothetical protein [Glaciihabitans sp. GrIS 2.15]